MHFLPLSSCPTPIGHLYPTRLPVKPAMTIAPCNDDGKGNNVYTFLFLSCPTFSYVMPFTFPSCPTVSLSCPTPIGHLYLSRLPVERLPVKPAMTIWYHALPSSSSCHPSLTSCPTVSLSCPTPIGHLRLPVKPAMT